MLVLFALRFQRLDNFRLRFLETERMRRRDTGQVRDIVSIFFFNQIAGRFLRGQQVAIPADVPSAQTEHDLEKTTDGRLVVEAAKTGWRISKKWHILMYMPEQLSYSGGARCNAKRKSL